MRKIERDELLGLAEYEQVRPQFRNRVIQLKKQRRVPLGPAMTLVFENRDTMLLQVQEMLRTERITAEAGILHELSTYNELIPSPGRLSATLFIEYEDKAERARMLGELADFPGCVALSVAPNGDQESSLQCVARFRPNDGEEDDRLPAVNYMEFEVQDSLRERLIAGNPSAYLEANHREYTFREQLPEAVRRQLASDLTTD